MPPLGHPLPRPDAFGKVTGKALYPGDLNYPDQTYMKIQFARRPHAVVRLLDTSHAEALEGVLAVFTAKDVPVNEYGLSPPTSLFCAVLDQAIPTRTACVSSEIKSPLL